MAFQVQVSMSSSIFRAPISPVTIISKNDRSDGDPATIVSGVRFPSLFTVGGSGGRRDRGVYPISRLSTLLGRVLHKRYMMTQQLEIRIENGGGKNRRYTPKKGNKEDQESVFKMLTAVLWLGNVFFTVIDNENHVEPVADEGGLLALGSNTPI
ncbi:Myosin-1 [Camellia lanceoleosa]|uniref:Myosin-1 n=1 Tax=Camellia lanceoleosa TaxID=1840588 RepID=A0ACC0IEL3_9ERIC|nr:Myosin-1 [Camellia lanceoleosa]